MERGDDGILKFGGRGGWAEGGRGGGGDRNIRPGERSGAPEMWRIFFAHVDDTRRLAVVVKMPEEVIEMEAIRSKKGSIKRFARAIDWVPGVALIPRLLILNTKVYEYPTSITEMTV